MTPDLDFERYAYFVWSAYGASLGAFLWMTAASLGKARYWKHRLDLALAVQAQEAAEALKARDPLQPGSTPCA